MTYFRRRETRRLKKRSRTIPLKGFGRDEGRYFRCWNCGFICDVERDSLGGAASLDGVDHVNYSVPTYGAVPNEEGSGLSVLGGNIEHFHVSSELDSSGNPKKPLHQFQVTITGGCPFCGTLNWRGDY